MEELIKLLEENKIEEAYVGFKNRYASIHDDASLYYITMIDLTYHQFNPQTIYPNLIKLANSNQKKIRIGIYDSILSFCLEYEYYQDCYVYSNKALKDGYQNFIVYFALAQGKYFYKKITDQSIENDVLKALSFDQESNELKKYAYIFLIRFFADNNQIAKAKEFLNKIVLTINDINFLNYLKLIISLREDSKNVDLVALENESTRFDALVELADYYYNHNIYDKAITYLSQLEKNLQNPYHARRKIVVCYFQQEKYQEGIDILLKEDLNVNDDANLLIAQGYAEMGFKDEIIKGIPYCLKSNQISEDISVYRTLADIYSKCGQFDNLKSTIDKIKKINHKDDYLPYLLVKYYIGTKQFKKAEKIVLKLFYKTKINAYNYVYYSYACFKNLRSIYSIYRKILPNSGNTFYLLKAYYYGDYGFRINERMISKYLEMAKKENESNCLDNLIGMIIQEKEPEEALKYFEKGMKRYQQRIDSCTCAYASYLNAKLRGIGTSKDVNYAYETAKMLIEENKGDISENLGNVYAESALQLNKNLDEVYEYLISNRERRYDISRIYMIIKVGTKLNKNVRVYKRQFRKALKQVSIRERNYYKNKPSIFMMNNY